MWGGCRRKLCPSDKSSYLTWFQIAEKNICSIGLCKTRKGVPELRGPALVCLSATDKKISVLVILMGQNPKCLRRVLLPPPLAVLANIHSILAYDVPDTEDVGIPSKFPINVGQALQSIAGSMLVNRLRRWPSTNHRVCCILSANMCHSTNTVSMSTLACNWNSIGWLYRLFWLLHYAGDL